MIYQSGDYSDIEIVCGKKRFKAHKAVVCPQSSFFAKACEKDTWKESHEKVIRLVTSEAQDEEDPSKDDPEVVQLMFDFLYLQSYGQGPSAEEKSRCNLSSHARLHAIGEKYGITHMKEAAKKRFDEEVEKEISSEIFVEAAKLGFTTTPDSDRG